MADLQDTHIHGDLRLDGDILMTLGSTSNASVNEYLNNIHFTVIDTSSKYVKQYDNGWFESWTKSTVPSGDFSYNAIGSSGLYYAAFTNMGIGITAKEVYDVRVSAANSGVIWTASCGMNTAMTAINGIVVQYGNEDRSTTLRSYVSGRWK